MTASEQHTGQLCQNNHNNNNWKMSLKNFLVVRQLGFRTSSTAEGTCSIPGQGTKIPQAV